MWIKVKYDHDDIWYIVNTDHIYYLNETDKSVTLDNGDCLYLSVASFNRLERIIKCV